MTSLLPELIFNPQKDWPNLKIIRSFTLIRLKPGQKAPNVMLTLFEGDSVELASYWGNGRSLLLIFLRHLA